MKLITKRARSKIAKEHVLYVTENFQKEVGHCIRNTKEYDEEITSKTVESSKPTFTVKEGNIVDEVFLQEGKRITVLNSASYLEPGGEFLKGRFSQEEFVCMYSILYPVLAMKKEFYEYNNKNKNRGLYLDRALFSEGVVFFGTYEDYQKVNYEKQKAVNVLTCSAPNAFVLKFRSTTMKKENEEALRERIRFIKNICEENQTEVLITGAFGCDSHIQDPDEVARMFKEEFQTSTIKDIIFTIWLSKSLLTFQRYF